MSVGPINLQPLMGQPTPISHIQPTESHQTDQNLINIQAQQSAQDHQTEVTQSEEIEQSRVVGEEETKQKASKDKKKKKKNNSDEDSEAGPEIVEEEDDGGKFLDYSV